MDKARDAPISAIAAGQLVTVFGLGYTVLAPAQGTGLVSATDLMMVTGGWVQGRDRPAAGSRRGGVVAAGAAGQRQPPVSAPGPGR